MLLHGKSCTMSQNHLGNGHSKYNTLNLGSMGVGGVCCDQAGAVIRAFSKHAGLCLAIKVEMLALVEGLVQAVPSGCDDLLAEGDSTTIIFCS
ncbi:hypothetical protein VitviT2T_024497 [Vitis vinifera]|uniref:RNase H type-1 domain-containing protein n=1 Tax=Vitis vinifera TaxID=29760 RepID=A0ABY9DHU4_VITVI|nr:hypothetical protein VitviT2T_024497 [Vitis vinifera]